MTDKSAAAIRRFAKKYKAGYILPEIKNGVLEFENKKDEFISDLTALISEHYVAKEEVDKMVSERLREELARFEAWYLINKGTSFVNPADEYIKSRDSHEC